MIKLTYLVICLSLIGLVSSASPDIKPAPKDNLVTKQTLSTDKDGKLVEGQRFYVQFPYYQAPCLCQVLKEEKIVCVCELTDILSTQMLLSILENQEKGTKEDSEKVPTKKQKDIEL